ncbi:MULTISPECIES: hypothetical protein, partial [Pseudomonadota]|uniref:hypothetical protein n=1 Tax=Pseudomonadota TaxID=1224 RepID=UPI001ABFAF7E
TMQPGDHTPNYTSLTDVTQSRWAAADHDTVKRFVRITFPATVCRFYGHEHSLLDRPSTGRLSAKMRLGLELKVPL